MIENCIFGGYSDIARGYFSKTVGHMDLKIAQRESPGQITPVTKFHRNLRCRVLFRHFLVDLSWNAPAVSITQF